MKFIGAHVSAAGGVENAPVKRTCHRSQSLRLVHKKSKAMAIASVIGQKHRTVQGELRKIRILTPIYTTA